MPQAQFPLTSRNSGEDVHCYCHHKHSVVASFVMRILRLICIPDLKALTAFDMLQVFSHPPSKPQGMHAECMWVASRPLPMSRT